MSEPFIISLNAIVKARIDPDGRRLLECEASNEFEDAEGDIILQSALLGSSRSFVATGHIDIDHISEIGHRFGVRNPESYIIGRPLEVNDLGSGRTGVLSEISRSSDGTIDVVKNRYDSFWESMISKPPVMWRASIYGYPDQDSVSDCREEKCELPASRFIVRSLDWRSLAMTRRPVNNKIKGYAKIVTAKAMIEQIQKDMITPFGLSSPDGNMNPGNTHPYSSEPFPEAASAKSPHSCPKNINELWGQYNLHISKECPHTMGYDRCMDSTEGFCDHFKSCCGTDDETAKVLAHALMYLVIRERKNSMY